ncbi:XRE family transcriptional regulator [Pseudonocardiaceae bacterium YIM PH 21723]|nr:XRE family transcriptional regulator [Pseudonocardiaceae bacterium YIM PH 21723]
MGDRREQLQEFLRSRRARLMPVDVGLPPGTRRRTPGLRREEVALLAGVGVSWYTWLEQGREITVSAGVLDAIARTLRLTEPERVHLYLLAGLNPPILRPPGVAAPPPEIRRLVDGWAPNPALLLDRYWNLLAVNEPARTIFGYRAGDTNCLVAFFTSENFRDARESTAAEVVAGYRALAAQSPDDPEYHRLAAELGARSPEFARLWDRHEVGTHARAVKRVAGGLTFDVTTLVVPGQPDWRLELYQPSVVVPVPG